MARCCRVIDLGLQVSTGQFAGKITHRVHIAWELPTELHVFSPDKGEEPHMISKEFTLSLHEKGVLRPFLQSWRGKPFTDEELEKFDVSKLLGAACVLNIVHNESNGNTYANIASIAPLMKGMVCPPAILPQVKYDSDNGRDEVFRSLPEWLQNKIAACENWKPKASSEQEAQEACADEEPQPF